MRHFLNSYLNKIKSILFSCFFFCLSLSALAQQNTNYQKSKYFQKGFYFDAQSSGGIAINERSFTSYINWGYGLDVATGYRFCPKFSLGLGFGGYSYFTKTGKGYSHEYHEQTTSVPTFVRLRYDILDRKLSPYIQFDFGYSFMILSSHKADDKIKYNDKIFMDRVYAKGFAYLSDYRQAFEKELQEKYANLDFSEKEALVNKLWEEEIDKLKRFSNGRKDYIEFDNNYLQYGKQGLFGRIDLGISYLIGDRARLNLGLVVALSQSYFGTCLRTRSNEFLRFGRDDYLPSEFIQEKIIVRTLGTSDFIDSFDLDLMLKVGMSF